MERGLTSPCHPQTHTHILRVNLGINSLVRVSKYHTSPGNQSPKGSWYSVYKVTHNVILQLSTCYRGSLVSEEGMGLGPGDKGRQGGAEFRQLVVGL